MTNLQVYIKFSGCGIGYYSVYPDPVSCECEICHKGTYNDRDSTQSCTSCPSGWTTLKPGATSMTACQKSKKFNYFHVDYCEQFNLEEKVLRTLITAVAVLISQYRICLVSYTLWVAAKQFQVSSFHQWPLTDMLTRTAGHQEVSKCHIRILGSM